MCFDVDHVPASDEASKLSLDVRAAAGSPAAAGSKDAIPDPEDDPLPLDLIKRDKKRAAVPSKAKRLVGFTTLAALRQRPQMAALRQREAKPGNVKAEQLRRVSPPRAPAVSDDTAGPSNAPLDLPLGRADGAAGSTSAEPCSSLAPASSGWNLTQPQGANQALREVRSLQPHGDSASPAPVSDEDTSPVFFPSMPQPKLDQETSDQAAVFDELAGAAGPTWSAAASAAPAAHEATARVRTAQVTLHPQRQQAQQEASSQQPLQASDRDSAWGPVSPPSHSLPDPTADASFPPLSQAVQSRLKPVAQPAAGLAADTASPSQHAGASELSLDVFLAPLAAGVRESGANNTQREIHLDGSVDLSLQAQGAEPCADSPQAWAQAGAALSGADTSILASSSAAAIESHSVAPAEPAAAVVAPLVFGQRVAGRGPFQLSHELQQALSGKPKPGRGKPALPLPEPSADLVLQRALMEKPKPRPRPRRTPVTPQSTGTVSLLLHTLTVHSACKYPRQD